MHYRAYCHSRTVAYDGFRPEGPVVSLGVTFGANRSQLTVKFGDEHHPIDLDPMYFRFLYILAWADQVGPFRTRKLLSGYLTVR